MPELSPLPQEWRAKPWALPESLQKRFGFQPGVDYPIPNDFEAEARHWKKLLYELRRTPEARDASQEIVDKLASQRRPPARRGKKAKAADQQQLSLFDEGGVKDM